MLGGRLLWVLVVEKDNECRYSWAVGEGSKVAEPGIGTYVSLSNIQRISGNREY